MTQAEFSQKIGEAIEAMRNGHNTKNSSQSLTAAPLESDRNRTRFHVRQPIPNSIPTYKTNAGRWLWGWATGPTKTSLGGVTNGQE